MKSRITIEVDFDNQNSPCIQLLSVHSDDVRDKLLKNFTQSLGGESMWCKIVCSGVGSDNGQWKITPITPRQLNDEWKVMQLATNPQVKVPLPQD
jgi:hypothetical protein